ncbi:MAG: nucleotidyltransferase domain-containing protein [Prevotellaceae bacterium]|jgi:predicted nucleotidyltransferase|nr:nucleotidyltransferase domain-containing protein [Prevotellaceae bacterium]
MNLVEQKLNHILELCKKYKVKTLYAFGSVLTDKFNDKSDVDLMVDFKRMPLKIYSDNYYDLKFSFEDLFNRPVDLLEYKALKNPYLIRSINQNKKILYGRENRKMAV